MTDEAIMERVRAGETHMMSRLFEKHQIPLYNFFFYSNRDRSLSEDLTQLVFERMLKYRSSFESNVNFKSWMYRIARNVSNDHWKKANSRRTESIDGREDYVRGDCEHRKLEAKEKWSILERSMNALDPETKELIMLTRIEKMKYTEVAQIFGVTEGVIKVRVHRGLKKLKHIYDMNYES